MKDLTFTAIGTQWCISFDAEVPDERTKAALFKDIEDFEQRFSRFLADSEVNAFRHANAGTYRISEEFATLLERAEQVQELTCGVYDPAAGALLEAAGYDAKYSMTPGSGVETFELPEWSCEGQMLTLDGPAVFDLGGIGKGYCIDMVSSLLKQHGHEHFVVDAGGDMYATAKANGSPWRVAIQKPGEPDVAVGIVDLLDRALAVSDTFRRRWGAWHHLVDPKQKRSIEDIICVAAVAPTAWDADCATSALFFAPHEHYARVSDTCNAAFLIFKKDDDCLVSPQWDGELFA